MRKTLGLAVAATVFVGCTHLPKTSVDSGLESSWETALIDSTLQRLLREVDMNRTPMVLDLPIAWQEIKGLNGSWQWHILGTKYWVRLHPSPYGGDTLDKDRRYLVHGVALQQDYGVISVWVYKIQIQ
jgi:hypothetical protein